MELFQSQELLLILLIFVLALSLLGFVIALLSRTWNRRRDDRLQDIEERLESIEKRLESMDKR